MSAGAAYSPVELLGEHVTHLIGSLAPQSVTANGAHPAKMPITQIAVSQYLVFFLIACVVAIAIVFAAKKRAALVPKGRFINTIEFVVDFIRNGVASIIKKDPQKYVPFLCSVFLFVLVNNLIGLIPGCKPGTGTIGGTFALGIFVFLYATIMGIRVKGGWGFIKGIVPHGLPAPIVPIVWLIEFFSMLLRPITHALRLFANMYAGHIVLGIFSILTQLFFMGLFNSKAATAAASPAWMLLLIAMYVLEFVVAFVQAYVFVLLSAVYIDSSVSAH
ncbi:MAG: F0F1 ATP synthase subunit A [Actinomycetia bacterium]|nr:F0F1 ATP synthase subunit A [Actinomycetes bacterium]